jgi:hypothetical protein
LQRKRIDREHAPLHTIDSAAPASASVLILAHAACVVGGMALTPTR